MPRAPSPRAIGPDESPRPARIFPRAAPALLFVAGLLGCSNVVVIGALPSGSSGSGGPETACGTVVPLASGFTGPATLGADGDSVYVMTSEPYSTSAVDGQVLRAPLSGGAPTVVVGDSLSFAPVPLAAQSGSLYWVLDGAWTAPANGGTASPLFNDPWVEGTFTLDAENIYFEHWGSLSVMPLAGPDPIPVPLYTGTVGPLVADATSLYWVDGTHVMKLSKAGGDPAVLASGQEVTGLVLDADSLYWTDLGAPIQEPPIDAGPYTGPYAGAVMRVPKAGGSPSVVASGLHLSQSIVNDSTGASAATLALDATHAYWLEVDGSVKTAPLTGGPVAVISAGVPDGAADMIVQCGSGVCWTQATASEDAGSVMRYTACP